MLQARVCLERSARVQVHSIDSAITVDSAASIRVDRGPVEDPDDLKARIARLEQVVHDCDREHRETAKRLKGRFADVERRQAERVDVLEQRLAGEREDERAVLRDSLTLQKGYAGLFAFGVVLTTWGRARTSPTGSSSATSAAGLRRRVRVCDRPSADLEIVRAVGADK